MIRCETRGETIKPMNPTLNHETLGSMRRSLPGALFCALLQLWSILNCFGQGTMTFTFEGQPNGTRSPGLGTYTEAGMQFSVIAPGGIFQNGGGIPGYPDNGTGYLETPDARDNFGGVSMNFTNFARFNLVSFDAAEYFMLGAGSFSVIGYGGMGLRVTNSFTLDGVNDGTGPLQDFQTFSLDSSFQNNNLFMIEFRNARFSLDNVVISGVPEPSAGAIALIGVLCVVGRLKLGRCSRGRELL